jgi:DHA3 family tetracycline resistance protein-like MFS transporter
MRRPQLVYTWIAGSTAFVMTLAFATVAIYRFEVAHLGPFQLVIVGTAMEASVFLAEIPTGVVADLVSRRTSVLIGHAGMALGLVLEASFASFAGVLVAQVVWGVAYTFTSGATEAWVAGELEDPDEATLAQVFFRAGRWASIAAVVAVPLSFALATWHLRAPLYVAGALQFALAAALVWAMNEEHFEPASDTERTTWARFVATARNGLGVVRRSRVLVLLAVLLAVAGGSSEAYDRYSQRHLLLGVGVPSWGAHDPLVVLAVLFTSSSLIGALVAWRMEHRVRRQGAALRGWISGLLVAQGAALVAFALTGSFVVAAVAVLVIERTRSVREKLQGAWIVPLTPKAQRATVLSTLTQCDAIGQVTVGPLLGAIGGWWSVPVALMMSAALLIPASLVARVASST